MSFVYNSRLQPSTPPAQAESELVENVSELLDIMNRAGEEVNSLEAQIATKETALLLSTCCLERLQETLRERTGGAFDVALPFFAAEDQLRVARLRREELEDELGAVLEDLSVAQGELRVAETAVGFGAHDVSLDAATSSALLMASERACAQKRRRESCERAVADCSRELQEALCRVPLAEQGAGSAAIKRAKPFVPQWRAAQVDVDGDRAALDELVRLSVAAKSHHRAAMRALEEISTSVHELRRGGPVDRTRTKSVIDNALLMELRPSSFCSGSSTCSKGSYSSEASKERQQSAVAVMRQRFALARQRRRDRAFDTAVQQFSQGVFSTPSCGHRPARRSRRRDRFTGKQLSGGIGSEILSCS
uniref:Uncharacterized protein n=1 Tax=Noctiluca scintillans TaxID=2966 RepID=A0A7S1ASG6_NOCSC|mmetsp:Transcript_57962/g.154456  ORF Transcript_57962/g.154456 Transcript_57962/m.154456 type:complete len:364 (+) Transcript_57962:58-1149(+)